MVIRTLKVFDDCGAIDAMVLVVPADDVVHVRDGLLPEAGLIKKILLCNGGTRRQDSVFNGLSCIAEDDSVVVIHDAVRPLVAAGLKSNVNVFLREGTYTLEEPWSFGPQDSGDEKFAIVYAAQPGETVVISGGRPITGWTKGEGNLWTAKVDGRFNQLFADGKRQPRARHPNERRSGGRRFRAASRDTSGFSFS